jgi:amino acid transporter
MGLDDWQHHGILHSQFGCVLNFVLPNSMLIHTVAELVSAYPTAGGMYYVTKHVVPKDRVAPWAWIVGWCNFLGQAGGVASLAYTISQMILATAVMHSNSDSNGLPSFSPTAVQTVLLAILVLCLFGTICSFPTLWLHKVILWFAPINSEAHHLPFMTLIC